MRIIDRGAIEFSISNGLLAFSTSAAIDPNMAAEIPTEGIHAFQSDRWYHVAVTFDGVSEGKLYWTEMFSGANQANEIGTFTMEPILGDLESSTVLATGDPAGGTTILIGLIDEVRISGIAREADDFFFNQAPDPDDQ